mmetsp:Transcript_19017/g.53652  ORF Transcript_19017/g.53652 Transcript_19017/m.53652 type:complete len:338 (+) Transcript_19017:87-1100(+)
MGKPAAITRNLTTAFHKKRHQHLHERRTRLGWPLRRPQHPAHKQPLLLPGHELGDEADALAEVVVAAALPPEWCDFAEGAREGLGEIRAKLAQLARVQQKRRLRVFDDGALAEHAVQAVAQDITALMRRCEDQVRQVGVGAGGGAAGADGSGAREQERAARQNAQRSLAMQLQQLSKEFRQEQQQYLRSLQGRQGLCDTDGCSTATGGSGPAEEPDMQVRQARADLELEAMETEAAQRSREICDIASSITDLHTIYKELAVMVIDQGTILDRIDYNCEHVLHETSAGEKQLQRAVAAKTAKSSCTNRVVLFLVALNLVLGLVLFVKHWLESGAGPPE